MKEVIRRYTVKGREVMVVKYTEDDGVVYHVEHDIPEYQKNCYWYYGECGKFDAIRSAQFVAGCIERDSYFSGTGNEPDEGATAPQTCDHG